MTTCAGNNTIAALIAGAIDDAAARRLEAHLDDCTACRHLVAALGRGISAISDDRLPCAGDRLGRYTIRRVVGTGGMGVVYEAHDPLLERRVALKLVRPDLDGREHLLVEAKAMAKLRHPNVAVVHDAGVVRGQVYMCMEYVAGTTLRAWLREPRAWREVYDVLVAAGRGLAYVHRAGMVHLDFKPENILVEERGRERRVVVTDFGLAKAIGRARGGVVAGTPAYMAPEQRRGETCDARADQFAFCATLREALGDRGPAALQRVIARGVAEARDDRFASLDELLVRMERAVRAPRKRAMAAAAVIAAAAVAVLVQMPRVREIVIERDRDALASRAAGGNVDAAWSRGGDAAWWRAGDAAPRDGVTHARSAASLDAERRDGARWARGASGALRGASWFTDDERADAASRRSDVEGDRDSIGPLPCDDALGVTASCTSEPPYCPVGTTLARHGGCWTCADAESCAPLGTPHACGDGTPLRCGRPRPVCESGLVASVRDGCWRCEDPFTCSSQSVGLPVSPPLPPDPVCGDGTCEAGEDRASCAIDCCDGSGCAEAQCGNGTCEPGEDHASCASDCCELVGGGSGWGSGSGGGGSGWGSGWGSGSGAGGGSGWGSGWGSGSGSGGGWGSGSGSGWGSGSGGGSGGGWGSGSGGGWGSGTGASGWGCGSKSGCGSGSTGGSGSGTVGAVKHRDADSGGSDGDTDGSAAWLVLRVTNPNDRCVSSCGNGFCETGEDHASCASDCCELGSNGRCVPVCGNGFCELGETCAADCGP